MNNEQKFNIGDLVEYDHLPEKPPINWLNLDGIMWGIIIMLEHRGYQGTFAKVQWGTGWADWYHTTYLTKVERTKR